MLFIWTETMCWFGFLCSFDCSCRKSLVFTTCFSCNSCMLYDESPWDVTQFLASCSNLFPIAFMCNVCVCVLSTQCCVLELSASNASNRVPVPVPVSVPTHDLRASQVQKPYGTEKSVLCGSHEIVGTSSTTRSIFIVGIGSDRTRLWLFFVRIGYCTENVNRWRVLMCVCSARSAVCRARA